jgi:hypothetical protein
MRHISKWIEFRNWIEVFGVISLIIGLGLVILQLRQNEDLLRFQIATELRINRDNDRNVTRGEQYSTTLSKLQTQPENMTDAELIEFDAHAMSLVSELDLRRMLADVGIFIGDWRTWLRAETCAVFDNPIGRIWLHTKSNSIDQEIIDQEIIDQEIIEELKQRITTCEKYPSFLKSVRDSQS